MSKRLLGVAILCVIAFFWGYLAHRQSFFPHPQFQSIAAALGWGETEMVRPRSDQLSLLRSLPYVQSSFDSQAELSGVIVNKKDKVFDGYTFYNSGFRNNAVLIDMDGNVVHEWRQDLGPGGWHHAELLPSGEILVVVEDKSISKLAFDSSIIWQYSARAHHGLWVDKDGVNYVLSRNVGIRPDVHPSVETIADTIVILGPDGTVRDELPLLDIMEASKYAFLLPSIKTMKLERNTSRLDVLHTNQVEVFDGRLENQSPLYKRGNILVSMRHINSVAIIDGDTKDVVWLWGADKRGSPTSFKTSR